MALTVRDLINHLSTLDQDQPVILAHDREGNAYSPLSLVTFEHDRYEAHNTWAGTCWDAERDAEYCGGTVPGVPCVTLWPVN